MKNMWSSLLITIFAMTFFVPASMAAALPIFPICQVFGMIVNYDQDTMTVKVNIVSSKMTKEQPLYVEGGREDCPPENVVVNLKTQKEMKFFNGGVFQGTVQTQCAGGAIGLPGESVKPFLCENKILKEM